MHFVADWQPGSAFGRRSQSLHVCRWSVLTDHSIRYCTSNFNWLSSCTPFSIHNNYLSAPTWNNGIANVGFWVPRKFVGGDPLQFTINQPCCWPSFWQQASSSNMWCRKTTPCGVDARQDYYLHTISDCWVFDGEFKGCVEQALKFQTIHSSPIFAFLQITEHKIGSVMPSAANMTANCSRCKEIALFRFPQRLYIVIA
jgi:hypothetical protein